MNYNEIRGKARRMGINTHKMKKTELIQAIQRAENNIGCYATDRVKECSENNCLWRPDCLSLNRHP